MCDANIGIVSFFRCNDFMQEFSVIFYGDFDGLVFHQTLSSHVLVLIFIVGSLGRFY